LSCDYFHVFWSKHVLECWKYQPADSVLSAMSALLLLAQVPAPAEDRGDDGDDQQRDDDASEPFERMLLVPPCTRSFSSCWIYLKFSIKKCRVFTSAPGPPAWTPGAVDAAALLLAVQEVVGLARERDRHAVQVVVARRVLEHAVVLLQRTAAGHCMCSSIKSQ